VDLEQAIKQIEEQEKEITRLKTELRVTKDKLFDKNRRINRMIDDTYDEVRLD